MSEEPLQVFRAEIRQYNEDHPTLGTCIVPGCSNKIYDMWDNQVLCREHLFLENYWFYELDGHQYCPEVYDFPSMNLLPKPAGADENMIAYRKRYCDWMIGLSPEEYIRILRRCVSK